ESEKLVLSLFRKRLFSEMDDDCIKSTPHDLFRILIATDIHLGFAESDILRANDTLRTFEEVLQIACDKDVDFVLLAGDLFHENKPSSATLTRCMELLRKYCSGNRPIRFQVVSDQKQNFGHTELFPYVNYEDTNINISMPIFSIHGNHDDPIGKDHLCALEAVSAAGYINYFGKILNVDELVLSPILLEKGNNRIALYGLGFLPEERLHRLFRNNNVKFMYPAENTDEWFNIFVVHQNRVKHAKKYLPQNFLTSLPDLVIWGHEHESIVDPEWDPEQKFYVYQPGSTVVTSFCLGEAKPKHVGLLEMYFDGTENRFKITNIPLLTPRKFYFEAFNVDQLFAELSLKTDEETLFKYCTEKVENILTDHELNFSGSDDIPKEPLIRLRIEYSDEYCIFSSSLFAQQFVGRVANPKEIILFKSKKNPKQKEETHIDFSKFEELMDVDQSKYYNIEDVINEYFEKVDRRGQMSLLCENRLSSSVKLCVEKDASADLIVKVVEKRFKEVVKELENNAELNTEDKNDIKNACFEYKEKQKLKAQEDVSQILQDNPSSSTAPSQDLFEDSDIEEEAPSLSKPVVCHARGVGRSQGRGRSRGGKPLQSQ
ncbi:double-strand break repair protein MRE11A-like protein, partial [Dinothrombium tinctorium]